MRELISEVLVFDDPQEGVREINVPLGWIDMVGADIWWGCVDKVLEYYRYPLINSVKVNASLSLVFDIAP